MSTKFTHKKTHKSDYWGVYPISGDKWETHLTIDKIEHRFGPFDTEREAALAYDREAVKRRTREGPLNFPCNHATKVTESKSKKRKRSRTQSPKMRKTKSKKAKTSKRKRFPPQVRMKVACRQGWRCNFCTKYLNEDFIIDHMLPLVLQGTNDTDRNIQALCSSCNRYKTTIFDYKVLLPLSKTEKLTPQRILKLQEDKYWEMQCIAAPSVQNQYTPHDCVNPSLKNISTRISPPGTGSRVNDHVLTQKASNEISITFDEIKLTISK